jgi:peroxiredoxin family protein
VTTETEGLTVPSFLDEEDTDRKLVIICSKGTLDMAYPGFIIANGALENGIETHLFFTFWGLDIIRNKTMHKLTVTPVGNTAMRVGGTSLSMPQALSPIPGLSKAATWMMKRSIAKLNVPTIPELVEHVSDAGAHLWACQMSVDMLDLVEDDFHPSVEAVINVDTFMQLSEDAQVLFV